MIRQLHKLNEPKTILLHEVEYWKPGTRVKLKSKHKHEYGTRYKGTLVVEKYDSSPIIKRSHMYKLYRDHLPAKLEYFEEVT